MAISAPASVPSRKAIPRGKRPERGDPVVDRAFALLAAFDPTHRRLTLSNLSRRSGTPLSTTRRLAERLVAWGALEREADSCYVIGLRLYEVASLAPRGLGLREVAMPFMEDLVAVTREHVQLAVREGHDAVLVERRSRPGAVEVEYRVGGRLPLATTAIGRVLLAHAGADVIDAVVANAPTVERGAELRRTLADVRRLGVAIVRRDRPAPLVAIAAPITGPRGDVVAALSLVVPTGRANPDALEPALRGAARGVARALIGRF